VGALTDPFNNIHMAMDGRDRSAQIRHLSRRSGCLGGRESSSRHQRDSDGKVRRTDCSCRTEGERWRNQFVTDESPRADATLENLAKLKPAFDKDGSITAGNASSLNDGAAAVVLMRASTAAERGLKPLARLVDYAMTGVEPGEMGVGPISAFANFSRRQD